MAKKQIKVIDIKAIQGMIGLDDVVKQLLTDLAENQVTTDENVADCEKQILELAETVEEFLPKKFQNLNKKTNALAKKVEAIEESMDDEGDIPLGDIRNDVAKLSESVAKIKNQINYKEPTKKVKTTTPRAPKGVKIGDKLYDFRFPAVNFDSKVLKGVGSRKIVFEDHLDNQEFLKELLDRCTMCLTEAKA